MDLNTALEAYTAAEHLKNSLIMSSQLLASVPSYPEAERAGAARMLVAVLEVVRGDAQRAGQRTDDQSFARAGEALSQAISLAESRSFDQAAERVGTAISHVTTAAQGAWGVLSANGLA